MFDFSGVRLKIAINVSFLTDSKKSFKFLSKLNERHAVPLDNQVLRAVRFI